MEPRGGVGVDLQGARGRGCRQLWVRVRFASALYNRRTQRGSCRSKPTSAVHFPSTKNLIRTRLKRRGWGRWLIGSFSRLRQARMRFNWLVVPGARFACTGSRFDGGGFSSRARRKWVAYGGDASGARVRASNPMNRMHTTETHQRDGAA